MSAHGEGRVRFHATATSSAAPERVYDVLADVTTHLRWAGEEAPRKTFRLLTLEGPKGVGTVGTEFRSTGANGKEIFHDRSTVIEAVAPTAFAFETVSRLDRKHRRAWEARFVHRYELIPRGGGTLIDYTIGVWPINYIPYWLRPGMKQVTRTMVKALTRRHLANLATVAEANVPIPPDS